VAALLSSAVKQKDRVMEKLVCSAGLALALMAAPALAASGSAADPIVLHMKRGTDIIRLHGALVQNVDCCTYKFTAMAGQKLHWKQTGAVARILLQYPDGHTDGPGLPEPTLLPADGDYLLTLSPDTMADGAFGKFTLTLTIPPLKTNKP
jgi:hypothetical protein